MSTSPRTTNAEETSTSVVLSTSNDRERQIPNISSKAVISGRSLGGFVNSLPPEVLSEIFYWCIPTATDQEYSKPFFALALGQVCSHWRNVALNTPRLWTYTKIRIIQQQLPPALELLKLYLERSKTCPIFVDVDFVDVWVYYHPVLHLFEQIVDFSRKYRPTYLLADSFLATHLEASSNENMAIREEWYFWSARPSKGEDQWMAKTNMAQDTSGSASVTLRALRLASGSFVLDPYQDWASSLTFLVIKDLNNYTNLTIPSATSILAAFPLLVHCTLHIDFDDATPLPVARVTLQHLKSFSLSWSEWVDTGRLLDALRTPALEELEMAGYLPEAAGDGPWLHLVQFLQVNRPPLRHLILDEIDCFHGAIVDALALTPLLEGLWMENCILDDSVLRGLHVGGSGAMSTLATIVLVCCYGFDVEMLAGILTEERKRRREEGRPGVTAYVDGCGILTSEKLERLKGMDILELGPSFVPLDFVEPRHEPVSV